MTTLKDLGIENGIHTWQVFDDEGNPIGFNQSAVEEPE